MHQLNVRAGQRVEIARLLIDRFGDPPCYGSYVQNRLPGVIGFVMNQVESSDRQFWWVRHLASGLAAPYRHDELELAKLNMVDPPT